MSDWPRVDGSPRARGRIRAAARDFRVSECLGVTPSGDGEHLWVRVRKLGWNTADVARWLAETAGVSRRSVSFSGLKDRHADTGQWFSLHLPGRPDPVLAKPPEGLQVMEYARHRRKLNRGTHRANAFVLRVTDLAGDLDDLADRLERVRRDGVPNYFGEQRFGRDGSNLERARAWLGGAGEAPRQRHVRGLWLSAGRSELFNRVLAERVRRGVWNRLLEGDVLQPDGSRGLFHAADDDRAAERVAAGEVHPTAPLPGVGGMASSAACAELERSVLASEPELRAGLEREGVAAARRATRLPVAEMTWTRPAGDELELSFRLPAGAFATAVLAELLDYTDAAAEPTA